MLAFNAMRDNSFGGIFSARSLELSAFGNCRSAAYVNATSVSNALFPWIEGEAPLPIGNTSFQCPSLRAIAARAYKTSLFPGIFADAFEGRFGQPVIVQHPILIVTREE